MDLELRPYVSGPNAFSTASNRAGLEFTFAPLYLALGWLNSSSFPGLSFQEAQRPSGATCPTPNTHIPALSNREAPESDRVGVHNTPPQKQTIGLEFWLHGNNSVKVNGFYRESSCAPTITKVLKPSTLDLCRPRLLSNKWERCFLTLNWERSPKADDKCGDEFKGFPSKQLRLLLEK